MLVFCVSSFCIAQVGFGVLCVSLYVRVPPGLEPFRFSVCSFWGWTISLRLTYQEAIDRTERSICRGRGVFLDQWRLLALGLDSVERR